MSKFEKRSVDFCALRFMTDRVSVIAPRTPTFDFFGTGGLG